MRIWFLILVASLFGCDPQPSADTNQDANKAMSFAATLPNGQEYDILANGDSVFYKTKDTTVSLPYTYKVNYKEVHPKGTTPPPVNIPPTARAGADQTITLPVNTVKLDASASTDPEGAVLKFFWRKVTGPTATLTDTNKAIATASNLVEGVYSFEVRAVDPLNAFTADFVTVTVKGQITPPVNQSPVARISSSSTNITLPVNTVSLSAASSTDADGSIASWLWIKMNGPNGGVVTNSTSQTTPVIDLNAGTYTYQLTVTDNQGAKGTSTINIVVNPPVVNPPTGSITPFAFTKNTAFKPRKFSGTENWNGQYYTSFTGGYQDYYFRFCWTDIEKSTQGNYVWTRFDQEFQKALNVKGKFSFGIMTVCDSDDFLAQEFFNNISSRYPKYVHDKMQTESVKDYSKNGQWIPNWNSTFFLDRFDALLKAIQAHIVSKGWQDKINYVDIRGYGQWGEWHSVGFGQPVSSMPAGTRPTVATYKRIVDGHIAAFPDYPLVALLAAMDANWLDNTMTPPEVTYYVLTAKNNWGLIGLRRDQWGATDGYVKDYLENNNRSFGNSGPFKDIIMQRWKVAPWVGEPMGPGSNLQDLPRQVRIYHAVRVGNVKYTGSDATSQGYFRTAENNAGYKIALTSGQAEVKTTGDFIITMNLENFGNTPCYENFEVVYELKNSSGAVVWTSTSSWHPSLKLPGTHSFSDTFRPSLSGTYTLTMAVKNGYRAMPLFNNGQDANGYMTLSNAVKF